MELNITIDTDEIYEREINFETLLSEELTRETLKKCKEELASDIFKEFSDKTAETTMASVKEKMVNFLNEDISLTDYWGKPTFIGSIEDLIKKRFDDVLLRPVDHSGATLKACTSTGVTWIEWILKKKMDSYLDDKVNAAKREIERLIKITVDNKIVEIKDAGIKKQVDAAFISILKK
ncbi:MAG: hypothetical protein JJW03_05185 [Desulfosarcina sp.]|nr:hypothetical protein [Desulfobacterales bacterium]